MDIGSILLILALLLLVALFVARPLFNREAVLVSPPNTDHEVSSLLAERDRILDALQELDFDQALGKIPPEDYSEQRALLVSHGADVLRELDRLDRSAPSGVGEDRIEAAIAARRTEAGAPGQALSMKGSSAAPSGGLEIAAVPDDELETLLAARRRARQDKSAGFCPQCGRPVQKSDLFCPKCGKALS
jgi:hypothetical protein